jgi:RimJ/RimL family protein N-acetyltransferase
MKLKRSTKAHKELFIKWLKAGRMEEITCREIRKGKHYVNPKVLSFSFFVGNEPKPVGKFNCFNINKRNKSCECGYTIDPELRGKGIGTKMIKYCLSYLFRQYNFNKLYCQTGAFNKPSIKILDKLGFHRDGILRQHHELDGKLWDDYIYSILRSEWKK